MPTQIMRQPEEPAIVTLTSSLATSPLIAYAKMSGGTVEIPSGSSITSLTFYSFHSTEGTFLPYFDNSSLSAPVAVVMTVTAGNVYQLPDSLFPLSRFKVVANAGGTVYFQFKG